MNKYQELSAFLADNRAAALQIRFAEIERMLGFKLPRNAYKHEAWWSNNDSAHSHARTWLKFGWRTEAVDLAKRRVTFRRTAHPDPRPPQNRDPWGCMAGTVTILSGTDLTTACEEVWNAEKDNLPSE